MNKEAGKRTVDLFMFSFLTGASYVILRAVGVSLFLARIGADSLPLALGLSALAVILTSGMTRVLLRRVPLRVGIGATWLGFAVITYWLSSHVVSERHSVGVLLLLYVLSELRGALNTVYLTTMSGDAFEHADSKRPFVLVAAGAPIAGVLFGGIVSFESSEIPVTFWFYLSIVLDVLTVILSRRSKSKPHFKATRLPRSVFDIRRRSLRRRRMAMKSAGSETHRAAFNPVRYLYCLACLMATKIAVLTLIGFQWKAYVGNYFFEDEPSLIAYFAAFYAICDAIIIVAQFTITPWLLDRFGIGLPIRIYPMLLGVLGVFACFCQTPWLLLVVFTLGRGLNVFRRSWHDPGLAVAYTILNRDRRRETILVVKGMVKPFSEAFTAIALIAFANHVDSTYITVAWIILLFPWFYFANWMAKIYERTRSPSQVPAGAESNPDSTAIR